MKPWEAWKDGEHCIAERNELPPANLSRFPTSQLKGTAMSLSIVHLAVTLYETVTGLQNGYYRAGPEPQRPSPTDVTLPRRLSGTKLKGLGRHMANEHPRRLCRSLLNWKEIKENYERGHKPGTIPSLSVLRRHECLPWASGNRGRHGIKAGNHKMFAMRKCIRKMAAKEGERSGAGSREHVEEREENVLMEMSDQQKRL